MNLFQSPTKASLYAVDKDSTLAKWNAAPPPEIKDALREHDNRESEGLSERFDEDDFKDEMYVEKLINHTTTAKETTTVLPIACQPSSTIVAVNPSDKKRKLVSKKKTKKRRKTQFGSKKNAQRGVIEKFWWCVTDDQGDWLEVKWLGSERQTFQLAHNLPAVYQPLVAKAIAKGNGEDVSWTTCAGNGAVAAAPLILDGFVGEVVPLTQGPPQFTILYQHKKKWCHLYSLGNVLSISKKKMNKARTLVYNATGSCGDFSNIADKAAGLFSVSLQCIQGDVNFVLQQSRGKWLLLKGVHCISVDCTRKLIFDSGRKMTLHLTEANLKLCGFQDSLDDLRFVKETTKTSTL
jgi:hypothetical protein